MEFRALGTQLHQQDKMAPALPEARRQKLRSGSWLQAVPTATKLPIHHHHDRVLPSKPQAP